MMILAQFTITCLLILIATGWSITFTDVEDMDLYIPLAILVGLMHMIIVGLGRLTEEDPYRYHDYDSWAGIVISVLKLCFAGLFFFFIKRTHDKAQAKLKKFIVQLGVLGGVYILSMPFVILILGPLCQPHQQHWVVTVGNMGMQAAAMLTLAFLFTSKQSAYYSLSVKGKAILPNNKLE